MVKAEAIQMMHSGKLMYHPNLDCGWVTIKDGRILFSDNQVTTLAIFSNMIIFDEFNENWIEIYPDRMRDWNKMMKKLDFRAYMLLLLLIVILLLNYIIF